MPIIKDAAEAQTLCDAQWRPKTRVVEFRKVRDRKMQDVLKTFFGILSESLQQSAVPFQSPEPEHEIQTLKHLMASNIAELQVITTSSDTALGKQPQDLEDALEAAGASLFTIQEALDECDGMLGDGYVVLSFEQMQGSPNLAKFADREALQAGADEAAKADALDSEDDTPQAEYNRAYSAAVASPKDGQDPHEVAYGRVTDNAKMADGFRWRVRIVDPLTFQPWMTEDDPIRPAIGFERGQMPLNPVLEAFSNYGLKLVNNRWELTRDGKPTGDAAVGSEILPVVDTSSSIMPNTKMVNYWQIRTREETVILFEHLEGGSTDDPGQLIRFPNPFGGKSTGYYVIGANSKLRGNFEDRYDSPILPMLVMVQHINMLASAILAMAYDEASRDVVGEDNPPPVPPADPTQETKSIQTKNGVPPPVAMGKVVRLPSTGVDTGKVYEIFEAMLDRFRSRDLLAGTGSSAETGVHLARLQTMLLTQLTPFQVARAEVRKLILQDLLAYVKESGQSVVIPWLPKDAESEGKVAKPRTITPKMAKLPVVLLYTIGADTPESKAAREQLSQQATEFGTISMETHQENSGVKDIVKENRRIAKSAVRQLMIGTSKEPGFVPTTVADLAKEYVKRGLEQRAGPLPPMVPPAAPLGPGIPAEGGGVSPVQVMPGGLTVAPGAVPMPVGG